MDKEQALGRAGWGRASEHERGLLLDIFGIDPAEVDAEQVSCVEPEPFIPQPRPEPVKPAPEIDALVDELVAGWVSDREIEAGA
jgi:hypothetical protein